MLGLSRANGVGSERVSFDPVRQVVDHAQRGVRQPKLAGDDALGRDRHPHHVRVLCDQPHLGRSLEPRPRRLPVDAAVLEIRLGRDSRDDLCAQILIEGGDAMRLGPVERRDGAEVEGDEVIGNDVGARNQLGPQAANGRDSQDTVAPGVSELSEVGGMVDGVWERVRVAVAIHAHDRLPAGKEAGGTAAEDDSEGPHPGLRGRDRVAALRERAASTLGEGVPADQLRAQLVRLDHRVNDQLGRQMEYVDVGRVLLPL